MVTKKTTSSELFDLATESAGMVKRGKNFIVRDLFTIVRDLFTEDEWNRIEPSLRAELGRKFLGFVENSSPALFVRNGKTSENQQIYQRL